NRQKAQLSNRPLNHPSSRQPQGVLKSHRIFHHNQALHMASIPLHTIWRPVRSPSRRLSAQQPAGQIVLLTRRHEEALVIWPFSSPCQGQSDQNTSFEFQTRPTSTKSDSRQTSQSCNSFKRRPPSPCLLLLIGARQMTIPWATLIRSSRFV